MESLLYKERSQTPPSASHCSSTRHFVAFSRFPLSLTAVKLLRLLVSRRQLKCESNRYGATFLAALPACEALSVG